MKKILAFIILLVYFTVSTGFVVSMHYCMDQMDSADLGTSHDGECGKCGMEKGENKCCWDEVQVLKLETSHIAAQAFIPNFSMPVVQFIQTEFLLAPFRNYIQTEISVAHSPPISEQDVYIENCVFRI